MASRPMLADSATKIAHSHRSIPTARARGAMKNSAMLAAMIKSYHTCVPQKLTVWFMMTCSMPSCAIVSTVNAPNAIDSTPAMAGEPICCRRTMMLIMIGPIRIAPISTVSLQ